VSEASDVTPQASGAAPEASKTGHEASGMIAISEECLPELLDHQSILLRALSLHRAILSFGKATKIQNQVLAFGNR